MHERSRFREIKNTSKQALALVLAAFVFASVVDAVTYDPTNTAQDSIDCDMELRHPFTWSACLAIDGLSTFKHALTDVVDEVASGSAAN